MARDMSTIEQAIKPQVTEQPPAPQPDSSLLPVGTPMSDMVEGQTKKRKPRTKKAKPPEQQQEEKTEDQPPTPLPDQQPEQQPVAQSSTQQIFQSARIVLRNVGVRLENVPTPGSIILPLILLLVFFFFLVPVNGSTRFTWLWLVLSGDASTSGSSNPITNSSGSNIPGSSGATGGGTSGANSFLVPSTTSTMTGVEDL